MSDPPTSQVTDFNFVAAKLSIAPATSQFLDLSRWGASLLVVITHVRSLVLANYSEITTSHGMAVKVLYFVTNFGHAAVVIFFVISGYLVGGRTLISARLRGYSFLDYSLHRFVRIYVVLIPAIFFGFLLDWIGNCYVDDLGLYNHSGPFDISSLRFSAVDHLSAVTMIGNLLQLQTILVPPLGSNGPLWSLASEWWYYVIAGLALTTVFYAGTLSRVVSALGAILLLAVLPLSITLGFIFWFMGAYVAVIDHRWPAWPASVGLVMLVVVMSGLRLLPSQPDGGDAPGMAVGFLSDLLVAGAFSFALLCSKRGRWRVGELNPRLASFSYTTYLVHFPAMLFLVSLLHRIFGFGVDEQPTLKAVFFALGITIFLYCYAFLFAYFTERHTNSVRAFLSRAIELRMPNALKRTRRGPKAALQ